MKLDADVFGRALLDWSNGGTTPEVLERDDGYTQLGAGPDVYLSGRRDWPVAERRALAKLRGRVVDVGCGAGRLSLHLQERGFDVLAMDSSPRAIEAVRARGAVQTWCAPVSALSSRIDQFDAAVFYGNNLGILETPNRARKFLSDLARRSNGSTRLFIESTNPYGGQAPAMDRLQYFRNVAVGVTPGQLRLRFLYQDFRGPWFQWFYASRSEFTRMVRGTGWRIDTIVSAHPGEPYVAILSHSERS